MTVIDHVQELLRFAPARTWIHAFTDGRDVSPHAAVEDLAELGQSTGEVRHIMAFGATPEEAKDGMIVGLLSGGFKQSVRMIADEMGLPLTDA